MIRLKRIYEPPAAEDGYRVLVERLWPRGLTKEKARLDYWLKEIAPSPELRTWYSHDIVKWQEFQRRYKDELTSKPDEVGTLQKLLNEHETVTFLFASKDEVHCSAAVLKEFFQV